jgi:polysaccharide pyruvyl transferase WcaK-like protein
VPLAPTLRVRRATPQIALLGAFDRFNLGDLLFPIVVEHVLQTSGCSLPVSFYSTVARDLRGLGGYKTLPLGKLFHASALPDESVVLIAGGEVLDARWTPTLETVLPAPLAFVLRRIQNRCGVNASDAVCRWLAGTRIPSPWVVAPADFATRVRVAYNGVGGSQVAALPPPFRERVLERLSQADFLSVRDAASQAALEAAGLAGRVQLAPDSAILISRIYSLAQLEALASPAARAMARRHADGYLCFQINKRLGRGQGRRIAGELEAVARRHGLGIVLLANGRARNHEDHVALAEVQAALGAEANLASGDQTIHDILFLIASARVYAGTSLHGSITSLAYAVPHVGLTQQVPKLDAFLRTWDVPEQQTCVPLEALCGQVDRVLRIPRQILEHKRDDLAQASLRNFASLLGTTGLQCSVEDVGGLSRTPGRSAGGDATMLSSGSTQDTNGFLARGVLP